MDSFVIEIAGLTAHVRPLYASTKEYCRNYLSDRIPEFDIEITESDLTFEQQMLDIEAAEEGLRTRNFTGPFLERTAIQRKMANALLVRDTLLIHGSTVAVDGGAYLFTATCGTGKSTHTRFWREIFGDRAIMVNDDKPFLRIDKEGVIAFGSPWSGKHGLDANVMVPLKGICILRRGSENVIHRISEDDARNMILHQTYVPEDMSLHDHVIDLVESLMSKVPLWEMMCTKEPAAAQVAYEAMSSIK